MTGWPDTTGDTRPQTDSAWAEARWLAGRHPMVAQLVERVRAYDDDEDGRWVHVQLLGDIVRGYDAYSAAWQAYRKAHPEPHWRDRDTHAQNEARTDAWDAAGPKAADYAPGQRDGYSRSYADSLHSLGVMSGTEQGRLRLLATVAGSERVGFCTGDLSGFDRSGQAFIRDWAGLLPGNFLG